MSQQTIQEKNIQKVPRHIALIPDGNRRWAKIQGKKPWHGHEEGAKRLEELLAYACKRDVQYFSVWGSSQSNLEKRPLQEKIELVKVYERYFKKLLESEVVKEEEIQISVIGMWREYLPKPMVALIDQVMEKTSKHSKKRLTIMIAYNGDDEILGAVNMLVKEGGHVDAERFKSRLMTHALPPVDLLIRTGGEPHMSAGFMMWDLANAEFYFTDVLFPDFDQKAFSYALVDFEGRGRRRGA